jgi:non-ribosomal peptide synthetase-like protein
MDILEATATRFPDAGAVDDAAEVLDYSDLLREVRRVGAQLAELGIGAGDRVGVRIASGTARLYVSILGVLSVGAAYVPVDVDDPDERAEVVWSDAGVSAVLTDTGPTMRSCSPPTGHGARRPTPDDDAWIIFTSGTTGRPKGVAITHRSAAALVDAEAGLFVPDAPLGPGDRVLAGLSVAFDASCEEMWLAWRNGACLVPAPRSLMRTGPELAGWLVQRRIDVVSTVPTMAALWPVDMLDRIRLLILGGEACPAGLADRLARRCPVVWNTYGPTEGTVVSSAARIGLGQPVRIGLPLNGWQLAVVDPASGQPVEWGGTGELVIAGAGVGRYLDPQQDASGFRPLPALGWDRAYRSGDLVRADPEGLTYLGRADSQVKIRGYRIELTEIESAVLRLPGVAQAAVTTYERTPGLVELAAFYRTDDQGGQLDRQEMFDRLRRQLPAQMVPAYLEQLAVLPTLKSGKTDRTRLPLPSTQRAMAVEGTYTAPATPVEQILADALVEVLDLDRVSVDSHLFDDLGLSSLLVAHYCAKIRERGGPDLQSVSTRDVYLHPTVHDLAAAVVATDQAAAMAPTGPSSPAEPPQARARTWEFVTCGVLQVLFFLGSLALAALAADGVVQWIAGAGSLTQIYLRALASGTGLLAALCAGPIAAKWILIGRWTPRRIRIWSLAYVRFWLVKTMISVNPLALFSGSPLYTLYLRALGAKIGRRVVILSTSVPVCADLLSIGDDTVIRRESRFAGYRARGGVIETGRVSIGTGAFIGEHTVLDIDVRVGDGAQLGHSSALHQGQTVPDGARWHGSPAQPGATDYRRVESLPAGGWRRVLHGMQQVLLLVFVTTPLLLGISDVIQRSPLLSTLSAGGPALLTRSSFYLDALTWSLLVFVGTLLAGAAVVVTLPRILNRLITPGRTYPLYGLHHGILRTIHQLTNVKFYLELFGDSSYVVGYLRALGYRMPDVEQTGSNFGADLDHETPFTIDIGRGTMISDGASLINADYSSTALRVAPLTVGPGNFLGTAVAYPAGARTGANVMIATKAMVPLDGPIRHDVGLLGSPCFEIPRSVTIDHRFDHLTTGPQLQQRLAAKNRHNIATMALFLIVRWVEVTVILMAGLAFATLYRSNFLVSLVGLALASLLFGLVYSIAIERATMRFGSLRPRYCSIYDPYFWWHERYWKLLAPHLNLFDGTPFKGLIWRLVGVSVGKRLFDDGCGIPERTLVSIGDHCTLNSGSVIQGHSMEDGIFKADHIRLDDEVTLGVGALVHYDVSIGAGAELLADSFLMKGEGVPAAARWGGNPARAM